MTQQATDFTLDTAAELAEREHGSIEGRSPWYLAWRRLRRNYVALFALLVFFLIVIACAAAPWYAENVAGTGPNNTHLTDTITVDGEEVDVISAGGAVQDPETGQLVIKAVEVLGPQLWHADGKYVLGADTLGRDVAVRVLYGGRNSLKIGIASALICTFIATVLLPVAAAVGIGVAISLLLQLNQEALDLRVLCRQVHDRVAHQVRDVERAVRLRGREVADRHVDVGGSRL